MKFLWARGKNPIRGRLSEILLIMRLSTLLILSAGLHVSAGGFAQGKISLTLKDAPLEVAFKAVLKQSNGYYFIDKPDLLKRGKPVSLNLKDVSLTEALDECFRDQQLTYEIQEKIIIVKPAPIPQKKELFPAQPPPGIHGRIVDSLGNPLEGASIQVKGTKTIVATDRKGEFEIPNADQNSTLQISYTGFQSKEIRVVKGGPDLVIKLNVSTSPLDEIQVIAYGTTSQRMSTGDVTTIKSDQIEKQPVDNPLLALEGLVPGMQITQVNGLPGSAVSVLIRGQNSIANGNDPLYVIDGVPYSSQLLPGLGSILGSPGYNSGTSNGNQIFGNPLSFINPSDIESISVLKDADATAIYGSRAANGAVLITTKKGKAGATKVDVNYYEGWGHVPKEIPVLNLHQYLDMRNEALKNDGATANPNGDYDLTLWDTTRSTNWQKLLIGGVAQTQHAEGSVSGGNNTTQFLLGAGYSRQTTVFPGDFGDEKGSVHLNVSNTSTNGRFKAGVSVNYMLDNNKLFSTDLTKDIMLAPDAPPIYNTNGSLNWAPGSSGFGTWTNPLSYEGQTYKNQTYNLVSNAVLSYQILKGLSIKSSFGYTNLQSTEVSITPHSSIQPPIWPYVPAIASYANNNSRSWIVEPQLTYNARLGGGTVEALVGTTIQSNSSNGVVLNGSGYSNDELLDNVENASTVTVASTVSTDYKYNALFGRVNYNWQNRYVLDLSARRDGSSRFGPSTQFHNFGAGGLAWIFSNESFFQKANRWLSFGKIRASYGTTGSDQVGDYRFLDLYYSAPQTYQNVRGLVINNLYNPFLAWEQTNKFEAGLQLGFLKDKISFAGSFYQNRSSNQLTGYQLPSTTGFSNISANQDATVQNKGFEFVLTTTNVTARNFRWSSSFNITINRNKVLSLGPNYAGYRGILGYPLGVLPAYHYMGVDPATGVYQFADRSGKPTFNPDTQEVVINLNPDYYGGFQNSFSYKGFQLDILLQFIKQVGPNYFFGNYPGSESSIPNQPTTVLDRWQKPGDIKSIQRFNQDGTYYNNWYSATISDRAYSDASFIRVKNVSLSYRLDPRTFGGKGLKDCRIYIQCQNLFTFTHYQNLDPETQSYSSLPPLRVITAGAKISF